jgi:hypothetical protein
MFLAATGRLGCVVSVKTTKKWQIETSGQKKWPI